MQLQQSEHPAAAEIEQQHRAARPRDEALRLSDLLFAAVRYAARRARADTRATRGRLTCEGVPRGRPLVSSRRCVAPSRTAT